MRGINHLDLLYLGGIYPLGLIVHEYHFFIWTYFTWGAIIHLDLLYMDGIYSFGVIVHGWH